MARLMSLGSLCLDLSYLYSRLVTTYSREVDTREPIDVANSDQQPLLPLDETGQPYLSEGIRQFMAMFVDTSIYHPF